MAKSQTNMSFEEWITLQPHCLHIQALRHFLKRFHYLYDIDVAELQESDTDLDLEFVQVSSNTVYVCSDSGSWGVVSSNNGKLTCHCCKLLNSCQHTKQICKAVEEESCPDFVAELVASGREGQGIHYFKPKCMSYKPIPFNTPSSFKEYVLGGTTSPKEKL